MTEPEITAASRAAGARRAALRAVAVVAAMGGLSFAAVPFYDMFCRATGFAGTTQRAAGEAGRVLEQTMLVRFDGNVARGMPWEFAPTRNEMRVRLGETTLATYRAHNPTNRTITGTASFNVTPLEVGQYFSKIACFCFTEQTLAPGETVEMPVTFFVDPALADDEEFRGVKTITLSYTFFETPERQAASAKK